jgi:hypothetical protein
MKNTVLIAVLAVFTALFGCTKGTSEAKKALEQYIEALKKGDFQTLYELNSVTQRKVALIHRGAEQDKEGSLKKNFEEYKALFDSIQNEGISNAVWAEKFLFPADSKYTISSIIVEEDKDSVTARFRKRWVARAEVKVEYSNKETAPIYGEERIKAAAYMVVLISGEDVVRGLQKTTVVSDWLFKSVNVKEGEVEYWPAS